MDYRIKISVDFGSTVSVLAWQLFLVKNEIEKPVEGQYDEIKCPTLIIEKKNNKGTGITKDLYGTEAQEVLLSSGNGNICCAAEFKEDLFRGEKDKKFSEAKRLTIKFMQYMRQQFEERCKVESGISGIAEKKVLFTTPLISRYGTNEMMSDILLKAGFTPEKGYTSLKKMDESNTLTDLAMRMDDSPLLKAFETRLSKKPEERDLVLFIDIGGLTADISLRTISYEPAKNGPDYQFRELADWPNPDGVNNPYHLGGGKILDKAICKYLKDHGFVNEEVINEECEKRGYFQLRKLKEDWNDKYWKNGKTPVSLSGLGMDVDKGLFPEVDYEEAGDKMLSPDTVIREIALDYIQLLTKAIKSTIRKAAHSKEAKSAGLTVSEETIDWIFLTGGGSKIFFLRPFLLGQLILPGERLCLKKIQENPFRIFPYESFSAVNDPTLSCAQGALVFSGRWIACPRGNYDACMIFYADSKEIGRKTVPVMKRADSLPITRAGTFEFSYNYSSYLNQLKCEILLYKDETEEAKENAGVLEKTKSAKADDIAESRKKLAKGTGHLLIDAGYGAAGLAIEFAGRAFNKPNLGKYFLMQAKSNMNDHWDQATDSFKRLKEAREDLDNMTIEYSFSVNEQREITWNISAHSEAYLLNDSQINMNFI